MYPLWDTVIEPVIKASGAARLLEIGALRGETTVRMLDALGPDSEIHVVDPLPEFDPHEHEEKFPGRYVFYRDLSLNMLPDAPPFDLALIDGDHNWYTVYNELRLLRETARRTGADLPVLILHDVLWPYGRRDLYYEPSQIPAEFRQPYARQGMRPDRKKLLPRGGMNVTLHNAETEGGPRNGVMTALDDFMAEHDRPLRRVVVPIYFGLAIVAEEERLERQPELRARLDALESPSGTKDLLQLSERIRLDATVFEHNIDRIRNERLARARDRYLRLLRGSLVDDHYIDNELRIEYLLDCVSAGRRPEGEALRNPSDLLRKQFRARRRAREEGAAGGEDGPGVGFAYATVGRLRLEAIAESVDEVLSGGVVGDLVECAAGRGGAGIYLRGCLEAHEDPDRQVWVADRFRPPSGTDGGERLLVWADLNQVRDGFDRYDLLDDRVRFLQGDYSDTLPDAPIDSIAVLHIGAGIGAAVGDVLDALYERVAIGGQVLIDDLGDRACADAVQAFRERHGIQERSERISWSGLGWRKTAPAPAPIAPVTAARVPARAPLAPPAPTEQIDLSVVVVVYDMVREAERTLHSLSRAYQRDIEDIDYEVIVVENGSPEGLGLGAERVAAFGEEFRYLDLGDEATPSPTTALNRGIQVARGRSFALMIDGAHVLTPGVVRLGMLALEAYAPSIVATQQWYIGPGQQPDLVSQGYDQGYEDRLFESIAWPNDGYRLFDIGHFIGERDWFDGILESNCLFAPRSLLEQVGCFDDSFSIAGGGYANLELFERLGSHPGFTVASILGEGSFHQVHGGTTTNDGDRDERRAKTFSYGAEYERLRGRQLRGPAKQNHYVGDLGLKNARRTRSRQMSAEAFAPARIRSGPDGIPDEPVLVPEGLRTAFVESFWHSRAWQQTSWLGRRVSLAPTDLVVYQELVGAIRPQWVIETGTRNGGRALFLASICELLGRGGVISVGDGNGDRPEHDRITYVEVPAHEPAAADEVRSITGSGQDALVILGARTGAPRTVLQFENFAPFVPVGSYVVVEDTIVNGHPVWPGFGAGPNEAVRRILGTNGDFMADTSIERYALTFNPGGYLKRIGQQGAP